ncbi:uncharacterized protein [Haliotis cracherodii]|uniref:uncharacterized protein n=1 Tax=Haliotis cracherodii TaxID=6455 RepID=UPI0039E7CF63
MSLTSRLFGCVTIALFALAFGVADGAVPCADCEFFYIEIYYPTQGMPVYAQPTYSAAGQLLYNYAPKLSPIHVFQIAGHQKIAAIVKVKKPGILSNLVVEITNLGMAVEAIVLYSFEAFSLFNGVPPPLAIAPLRALPCARVYHMEVEVIPLGNATQYLSSLRNFTVEMLRLRRVGIILDMYKHLARIPATFMILGCGTPTFFDQLTFSFTSLASDYGAFSIGRVDALTKWNPLIGGKGGSCFWGQSAAGLFPVGKKKKK